MGAAAANIVFVIYHSLSDAQHFPFYYSETIFFDNVKPSFTMSMQTQSYLCRKIFIIRLYHETFLTEKMIHFFSFSMIDQ